MDRARQVFGDRKIVSRADGGIVEMTYAELFERVDRLAHVLQAMNVKPGDRVGTMAWNHHRHLELYIAVTMSGAVLHTVNVRLSPEQAVQVCEHAGDKVVFVDSSLPDLIAATRAEAPHITIVQMGPKSNLAVLDYESLLAEQSATPFVYPPLSEDMPAATSYSSATTGIPKGVVYTHRAMTLHAMMLAMADTWAISESDCVLPIVPMFHVNAWGLPFAGLWMGSQLVLPGERPTAATLLQLLARYRVTMSAAVPTVWNDVFELMATEGIQLPLLRLVVSGGAPLPNALLHRADTLDVPLIHSYGMTEASPVVLVGRLRSDAPQDEARNALRLKQGYVVPGLSYRLVAEGGIEVPWDGRTSGELNLRGPWVAEEYERDERSKDAFVDGWYRTGDVATIDANGYIQIVDRKTDMIKSGGEWISSVEIEVYLTEHPAVSAAAVIGVPDERWTERPCAYVVLNTPASPADLRRHLELRFPKFWLPDHYIVLDEIPLTSVGKYDKRQLRTSYQPADRSSRPEISSASGGDERYSG